MRRSILAGWLALAAPAIALGQPSTPASDPKVMAARVGEEALALHGKGEFAAAYERFETAEKIAHSPVFVLWMARSKRALGELGASRKLYERVAAEEVPSSASAKSISAHDDAKSELAALVKRIPKIRVELTKAADAALDVDGVTIAPATEVELDPGDHAIHATAPAAPSVTRAIHLEEGQPLEVVQISLDEAPKRAPGSLLPGGVVLGVGLVGLAGGAVTGAYALVLAGEVKEGCVGNQCRRADEGKAGDADTLARASTGLLIAGGVISAVGVGLMIARPRIGGEATQVSLDLGPLRARATLAF